MQIQDILKTISTEFWLVEKENNFFIKYDEKWEKADFFHYVFDEKIIQDHLGDWFEKYSNDLWETNIKTWKDNEWEEKQLKEIDSFDKNLNLIVLLKLEKSEYFTDELKKQIYQVEENPYCSNKFVLVYTEEQIKDLDILKELKLDNLSESFDKLLENRKGKDKKFLKEDFIFDVITSLHFITFDFKIQNWSESVNIYNETYKKLPKKENKEILYKENIFSNLEIKDLESIILKSNDIGSNWSEFEDEIIKLSKEIFSDSESYDIENTFEEFKTNYKEDGQI